MRGLLIHDYGSLLVCVNRRSPLADAAVRNGVFTANVLTVRQAHVSDVFAGRPSGGDTPYRPTTSAARTGSRCTPERPRWPAPPRSSTAGWPPATSTARTASTLLLSYLAMVPALIRLRLRHAEVPRPYEVPFGTRGFVVCASLVYAWIVLGCWVALFPGTLKHLVGLRYDFADTWDVSRATFETFTLGTVALLLAVGALGLRGRRRTG
ncbi:flavin reductase family protein [Streptomyces niger]|uniref:flavin reductase family protein n=1 Tax=Streptomyces niger TaxID=66373 RepID=UPI00069C0ADA|nr:flavin reductase family protein [Streptomyces niger]